MKKQLSIVSICILAVIGSIAVLSGPALACCGVTIEFLDWSATPDPCCVDSPITISATILQTDYYNQYPELEPPILTGKIWDPDGNLVYDSAQGGTLDAFVHDSDRVRIEAVPRTDTLLLTPGYTPTMAGTYTYELTATAPQGGMTATTQDVFVVEQCVQEIQIDIKPGSYPNSINLGENGKLPVAVLKTADFDPAILDPATINIGGVPLAVKKGGALFAAMEDVDLDGDLDLIVHFNVQDLVKAGVLTAASTELTLSAESYAGDAYEGTDSVRIVPPK